MDTTPIAAYTTPEYLEVDQAIIAAWAEHYDFMPPMDAPVLAVKELIHEANWKVTVENYLECYHCGVAHATTLVGNIIDQRKYIVALNRDTFVQQTDRYCSTFSFPNRTMNVYSDGVLRTAEYIPLAHNQTLNRWTYYDAGIGVERGQEFVEWYSNVDDPEVACVIQEDKDICDSVQKGMESVGYDAHGPLNLTPDPNTTERAVAWFRKKMAAEYALRMGEPGS